MPHVVWAEEYNTGLEVEIGLRQQKCLHTLESSKPLD